ncbi:hypothetical protein [Streptomyces laurentii]|uniref:hypothetical protein n=1 Tax=Streptomyces laurentii TaxID=39478 RepID=UPI0033F89593
MEAGNELERASSPPRTRTPAGHRSLGPSVLHHTGATTGRQGDATAIESEKAVRL